jgi:hypothetical protein
MSMQVRNYRLKVLSISDYARILNLSYKTAAKYYKHDCEEFHVKGITCTLFACIYRIEYTRPMEKTGNKGR